MLNNLRRFRLGFYFDMYSDRESDWQCEIDYNRTLNPECLDVLLEFPGGNNGFSSDSVSRLRSSLGEMYLAAHAPTLNLSFVALNPSIVAATISEHLASLRVASDLGAKMLTIHGGEYPYYASHNGRPPNQLFTQNIRPLLDAAEKLSIEVCIENLKGRFVFPQTIEDLDSILRADPRLKFALDIRHFVISGVDPLEAFQRFHDRVRSIHFRIDNGLDDLRLSEFMQMLLNNGYDGCFLIEDAALNLANKAEKPMITDGVAKIRRILDSFGSIVTHDSAKIRT